MSDVPDIDPDLKVGDVAIDLVERGKVQVVAKAADTVAEYEEREDFSLQNYKSHPLLDVSADEPVWTCVYLPDAPSVNFSGSYDFPESRLARVPIEEANDDFRRVQRQLVTKVLEGLIAAGREYDGTDHCAGPAELARDAGIDEEIVDEALELAQVEEVIGGDA